MQNRTEDPSGRAEALISSIAQRMIAEPPPERADVTADILELSNLEGSGFDGWSVNAQRFRLLLEIGEGLSRPNGLGNAEQGKLCAHMTSEAFAQWPKPIKDVAFFHAARHIHDIVRRFGEPNAPNGPNMLGLFFVFRVLPLLKAAQNPHDSVNASLGVAHQAIRQLVAGGDRLRRIIYGKPLAHALCLAFGDREVVEADVRRLGRQPDVWERLRVLSTVLMELPKKDVAAGKLGFVVYDGPLHMQIVQTALNTIQEESRLARRIAEGVKAGFEGQAARLTASLPAFRRLDAEEGGKKGRREAAKMRKDLSAAIALLEPNKNKRMFEYAAAYGIGKDGLHAAFFVGFNFFHGYPVLLRAINRMPEDVEGLPQQKNAITKRIVTAAAKNIAFWAEHLDIAAIITGASPINIGKVLGCAFGNLGSFLPSGGDKKLVAIYRGAAARAEKALDARSSELSEAFRREAQDPVWKPNQAFHGIDLLIHAYDGRVTQLSPQPT